MKICYTPIYKTEKQQGPPIEHRNYSQYLVRTYNGKESDKYICIYMYACNNHIVVHLTPHCKSTMLQF